eukprot:3837141-Pyramimonas_sp.AAC.2
MWPRRPVGLGRVAIGYAAAIPLRAFDHSSSVPVEVLQLVRAVACFSAQHWAPALSRLAGCQ